MKEINLKDEEVAAVVTNRAQSLEYAIRFGRDPKREMTALIEALEALGERIKAKEEEK